MTERRRDERHPRTLRFQVNSGQRDALEAESVNLSTRGLYCLVERYVAPFSKLRVGLDLHGADGGSHRLDCEGVVVRVEPEAEKPDVKEYRVAIYFLNLPREDAELVARYLNHEL